MGQDTQDKEEGEQVFEVYLKENNLPEEYEPPALGPGTLPDYLVHAEARDILCEVKGFGEAGIDRKIQNDRQPIRLSDGTVVGGIAVGSWDPLPRIRDRIVKAAKQLLRFKGKYPCAVILYNPGYMTDLGNLTVRGAMFGNPAFSFPVSAQGGRPSGSPIQTFFSKDALLFPNKNTTISAVVVLEMIRPNFSIMEEAVRKQHEEDLEKGLSTRENLEEAFHVLEDIRKQYPDGYFDETHPRVRVHHNPFAACPLPLDVFKGPYDQQTWQDPKTGETKTIGIKKPRSTGDGIFKKPRVFRK